MLASDCSRPLAPSLRRFLRSVIGIWRQMQEWGAPSAGSWHVLPPPSRFRLFQHWLCVGIVIAVGGEDGSEPFLNLRIQVLTAVVACATWLDNYTNTVVVSIVWGSSALSGNRVRFQLAD